MAAIDGALSKQLAAILHQPRLAEAGGHLARPALSGHEQRDQRQAEDQGPERLQARAVQGRGQGRRVRPEPDVQEAVRERVRHARRRALRRPDRRLRVHEPPRGRGAAGQDVQRGGRRVLPVRRGRLAQAVRLRPVDGAVQAARPGEDLRHRRVRQVAVVPRVGGLAVRGPGHAARAGPAALRIDDQADRGIRLRGSGAGRGRPGQAGAARPLHLDERRVRLRARS